MLAAEPEALPPWQPATRVAFRSFAVYFGLYVVMTQMLGGLIVLPKGSLPRVSTVMNPLVACTGTHVFHVTANPVLSGSGDKMYDWVQTFCLIVIAAAGTRLWSILDRAHGALRRGAAPVSADRGRPRAGVVPSAPRGLPLSGRGESQHGLRGSEKRATEAQRHGDFL